MSRTAKKSNRAKPYHHGRLDEVIIQKASEIYLEKGLENLSIRSLSKEIGVSPMAFYHHFPDFKALINGLVVLYLTELETISTKASEDASPGLDKLYALGRAYVWFAYQQPLKFRLIFNNSSRLPLTTEWQNIPVYRLLFKVVKEIVCDNLPEKHTHVAAISAWSLVHGLAELLNSQIINGFLGSEDEVHELVETVLRQIDLKGFADKTD